VVLPADDSISVDAQVGSYVTTFSGSELSGLRMPIGEFLSRWCGWILTNTNIDVPMPTLRSTGYGRNVEPDL